MEKSSKITNNQYLNELFEKKMIELKEIVKREFDAAVSTLNEEQIIRY